VLPKLIAGGFTGRKGKGGFYRMDRSGGGKRMQSLDLATGDYREQQKATIAERDLPSLLAGAGPVAEYARRVFTATLAYSAMLVGEVADDIVAIDAAMRLGYNWKRGPFEMIDQIGAAAFADQLRKTDQPVPQILASGQKLYRVQGGKRQFLGLDGAYHDFVRAPGILLLSDIKLASKRLRRGLGYRRWRGLLRNDQ
jgi:3-hydroxyacyl-CoA dehydrogenase